MEFKNGVYLSIQPKMAEALPLIDAAYNDIGFDAECVITSANDSRHMSGSLHYAGLAVDLRTRDLHPDAIQRLVLALRRRLNGVEDQNRPYQVVIEKDHVHLEYQPEEP